MTTHCILCQTPIRPRTAAGKNGEFCCAGCEKVYDVLTRLDDDAKAAYVETARKLGLIPSGETGSKIPLNPPFTKGETGAGETGAGETGAGETGAGETGAGETGAGETRTSPFEKGGRGDFVSDPLPTEHRTERLTVDGLVCPSCSWVAGEVLSNHDGVVCAEVSYFTGTAEVTYDLAKTSSDDLDALLRPLGYGLSPVEPAGKNARSRRTTFEFIIVAILAMNVMSLSVLRYFHTLGYLDAVPSYLAYLEGLLVLPILAVGWIPTLRRAVAALRYRRLTMDLLITIGVGAAGMLSYVSLVTGRHDMYFETCAGLVTISLLSRMIEARLRDRAFAELATLMKMPVGRVRQVTGDEELYVETAAIAPGDRVRFLANDTVPFDGEVVGGPVVVSEAVLTGEPTPLSKGPGDLIVAGSQVTRGPLEMTVTRRFDDTLLSQITRSIGETLSKQEGHLRKADRIATWFIPAVVLVAIGAWVVRAGLFGTAYALSAKGWFPSIAVLAVACPCAFSLAGISAVTAATGALLRKGFLVKELDALERLAAVNYVVFDKTGTLTKGVMSVASLHWEGVPDPALLEQLIAAEHHAAHPAAEALRAYLTEQGVGAGTLPDTIEEIPGQGRIATFENTTLTVGAASLFDNPFLPTSVSAAHSAVWFGKGRHAVGCFLLTDEVRPEASAAVAALKAVGMEVTLLSGDRQAVTQTVASSIGIDTARGDATIDDKIDVVRQRLRDGKKLAFIGDGTNDALAMNEATVSVALAKSTDEALGASDFVALSGNVKSLGELFRLGRKLSEVVTQNYLWAFAFNTLFIPIAALGKLIPLIAMLLMLVSSIAVLVNATRLR